MGVVVDIVQVAAITSGGSPGAGDQVITGSLGGLTPKAAIFIVSNGVTDNLSRTHAAHSFGFTSGGSPARQYAFAGYSNSGTPNSETGRRASSTNVIRMEGTEGGAIASCPNNPFAADSVTINWSVFSTQAKRVTCILFAGDDLEAFAGSFTRATSIDTATSITDTGFLADQVIIAGTEQALGNSTTVLRTCIGFVDRQASITQACHYWNQNNGSSTSIGTNWVDDRYANRTSGAAGMSIEEFSGSSPYFKAYTRNAGATADPVGYLALKYNGAGGSCPHWVGVVDSPTTDAVRSETAPGIKPQFIFQLTSSLQNVRVAGVNSTAVQMGAGSYGMVGMIAPGGVGEIFTTHLADDDAATTMATSSYSTFQLFFHRSDTGLGMASAQPNTLVFTSGGYDLAYTGTSAMSGIPRKWPTLVVGGFAAGAAPTIPVFQHSYRQRRDM